MKNNFLTSEKTIVEGRTNVENSFLLKRKSLENPWKLFEKNILKFVENP